MRGFESLMSRAWPDMATMVKRRASAPNSSTSSSGSMTLPLDFDILAPSASRIRALMKTRSNGTFPVKCRPIIIIRATQKKMMSKPVTRVSVG